MTDTRLGYMSALDGLRAVAIVLVVGSHAVPAFWFGMLGVDVFFVLSGFLITAIIARQIQGGRLLRRRFYARRAIRLVPALTVMVAVMLPIGMPIMKDEPTLIGAVAAVLYLTPLLSQSIFQHTWTLAIEEWFYLVWPLMLSKYFRDQLTLRQAALVTGAIAVVGQLAMLIAPGSIAARPSALMAGSALALWWLAGGRFRRPNLALMLGLGLILVGAFAGTLLYGPLPFWFGVGGAVLVVGAVASGTDGRVVRVLESRPLVAVGVVSYEWYLLHAPMLRVGHEVWGSGSYLLLIPLSLLLAFGLHHALVPLQARMRRRLDARLGRQTTVAAPSIQAMPLDQTGLPRVESK